MSTYIFPHVPKTGGTSLRKVFEESDLVTYFDYEFPPSVQPLKSRNCERRNSETSHLDFSVFDMVFGHFPKERYSSEKYEYITLLRHPVDRAISHFFYWKNYVPEKKKANGTKVHQSRNLVIQDIRDGNCSFSEFLKRSRINKVYEGYFGYENTQDFKLVGFQHDYDKFYSSLCLLLDVPEVVPEVKKKNLFKEELSKSELVKAERILKDEIEWFEKQRTIWE